MTKIVFTDSKQPVSASRPKFWKGVARTPKKYREYKEYLTNEFQQQIISFSDYKRNKFKQLLKDEIGIKVKIDYRFYLEKVDPDINIFNKRRPDLDNLMKASIDSLFQTQFIQDLKVDDSRIVQIELTKFIVKSEAEKGQTITLFSWK